MQLFLLRQQKSVVERTPQHPGTRLDQISFATWRICLLSDLHNASLLPMTTEECC
ncbi:hypothetical protein C0J52_00932 [Blattella germanica]|nr:hypothetical protein C0J52_00932 [Blattella germanica]